MKTTILAAICLAIGTSALGASALTIYGSDTMKRFTQSLVNTNPEGGDVGDHCVGAFATLQYIGGASGTGEIAMVERRQHVAMMDRALGTELCGFSEPPLDTAEGIAFAKDGITVISAFAGTRKADCDPSGACPGPAYPAGGTGLGPNVARRPCTVNADCVGYGADSTCAGDSFCTTADTFAPGTWRWVLRLVYWGLNSTDKSIAANRNCLDSERINIVNNYGNLFDNACTPGGIDGTGQPCTQVRRAFRRDEASGTTEIFRSTMGAGIVPFCNVWQTGDPAPACPPAKPAAGIQVPPYSENFQDNDPVRRPALGDGRAKSTFTANSPTNEKPTEQVASIRGDLGVVIPISIPPQITNATLTDYYPQKYCTLGITPAVQAVSIPGLFPAGYGLCPDGTVPGGCNWNATVEACQGGPGVCMKPASTTGGPVDVRCLNPSDLRPIRPAGKEHPSGLCTPPGGLADGRVFNLHNYQNTGNPRPYMVHMYPIYGALANREMVGSFFRIHTTRVGSTAGTRRACAVDANCTAFAPGAICVNGLCSSDCDADADCSPNLGTDLVCASPGATGRCVKEASCGPGFTESPCCIRTSNTDQIGCLAAVSECTVGFGGSSAKDVTQAIAGSVRQVFDVSLNAATADPACIQDSTYPLARDLYLQTNVGFENLTRARFTFLPTTQSERNSELELARCLSGSGALQDTGGAGLNTLAALFARYDLVARTPACVEFNEGTACGEPASANACDCTRTGTGYGPGRPCTMDSNCTPFVATATCNTDGLCSVECNEDGDCTAAPYTTCAAGICIALSTSTTTPAGIPNGSGVLCP